LQDVFREKGTTLILNVNNVLKKERGRNNIKIIAAITETDVKITSEIY
jgi:hypothetical protein